MAGVPCETSSPASKASWRCGRFSRNWRRCGTRTPCQHIQFLYSHGDYRSHGGWYTLVTTTNLSKSSQNGCHWTASSLKKRKRSTCLQEGGLGLRLAPSPDNTIMEIRGPCRIILQFSASFCTPRRTARRSGSTVAGWLRRCQQNDVRRQTPGHWTTGCQTKKGIIKPKIIKQQNWHRAIEHWARMRSSDNENCGTFPVTTAARPYIS